MIVRKYEVSFYRPVSNKGGTFRVCLGFWVRRAYR